MRIYQILSLLILILISFGCISSEKQVDVNVRILASDLGVGESRLPFVIINENNEPVYELSEKVIIEYCAYECTEKKKQNNVKWRKWPVKGGIYTTYLDFDKPGYWKINFSYSVDEISYYAESAVTVKSKTEAPNIGEKAPITNTKTAQTIEELKQISSTVEPDLRLYKNNLVNSLANNRPIIISFSTPGFCFTKTCGPQINALSLLADKYSNNIDFIHVEIFDNPNEMVLSGDYSVGKQAKIIFDWELATEPWTFFINNNGTITDRFEGFVTIEEIEESMKSSPIYQ
ncbi:MAG: hypothetical protein ACJ0G8_01100 [Dehalococcoidia bacterium]